MEPGDTPLLSSWAATAADLFQCELQELAQLTSDCEQQDESAALAMRARAEVEADVVLAMQPAGDGRPTSSRSLLRGAGGGSRGGKPGGAKKQQQQPPPQQQQQQQRFKAAAQAIIAEQVAAKAKERAAMVDSRFREMQRLRDSEPWRQLINDGAAVIARTERVLGPVRERERLEYDYFMSKPLEAFTMDDIVGTAARNPLPPSQHEDPSTEVGVGSLPPSEFVIDAGAFAQDYNAFLSREYGYKPVFAEETSRLSTSKASATPPSAEEKVPGMEQVEKGECTPPNPDLRTMLATHRPGLGTTPPAFCVVAPSADDQAGGALASSLPPLCSGAAASVDDALNPRSADGVVAATKKNGGEDGRALASSVPSLPLLAKSKGKRHVASRITGGKSGKKSDKPVAAAAGAQLLKGIECSLKNKALLLRTYTGVETRATVRFTNRNANPTQLRLRPSSHAWLRFQCVSVAPVAGAAGATTINGSAREMQRQHHLTDDAAHNSQSLETTPLSYGGYIEVVVSFNPADMSEPAFEELLQVGVTREVNSRDAEGGQWFFYSVPVTCETVLPAFHLSRCASPEVADDGSTRAMSGAGDPSLQLAATYASYADKRSSDFPPTFVFATATQHYTLTNTGSACLVSLRCSSASFQVSSGHDKATTLLPQGGDMDVAVTFAPQQEGRCETVVTVLVRDAGEAEEKEEDDGDDDGRGEANSLAQHTFTLVGFGVVPRVHISRIGDQALSAEGDGGDGTAASLERAVAKYIAQNVSPEVELTIPLTVVNTSAVPLPYYWDLEAIAGYDDCGDVEDLHNDVHAAASASAGDMMSAMPSMEVEPAVGVLPGEGVETTFHVRLTSHSVAPVLASLNLFLVGVPDARLGDPQRKGDSALVALFRKDKQLPSAYAALEEFSVPGAFPPAREDVLADPYAVFKPYFQQPQVESASESNRGATFVAGLFLFAKPVAPSVELMPPALEEAVECLTGLAYERDVTLHNPSPCEIHFLWDPTDEERTGQVGEPGSGAWQTLTRQKAGRSTKGSKQQQKPALPPDTSSDGSGVDVLCFPRVGSIPPNGSVTVRLQFTVATPGPHVGTIPLYIPELDRGVRRHPPQQQPPSDSPLSRRSTRLYHVYVCGVGPSVHVSAELLDFGLIEFGAEAAASFTVTNDNPVPVMFDLQDPLMREPPRFVFIPPSFRLGSGASVEVTVYRKAASTDDAQTYFELTVRGGATLAIETRATIQKPTMMLDVATVNFGRVPEGVWQERCFHLTNLSALDMPFTVELAVAAGTPAHPCVELELPTGIQTLRAGQKHCAVKVRARFTAATASRSRAEADKEEKLSPLSARGGTSTAKDAYRVLLGIRSKRRKRTSTGATSAGQVLLLELCCDEVERLALSVDLLVGSDGRATASACHTEMPIGDYVRALLSNLVEEVLAVRGSRVGNAAASSSAADMIVPSANPRRVRPYCVCPALQLTLPEDSPVCVQALAVRVANHSGCVSSCAMAALRLAPFPIITSLPNASGTSGKAKGGRSARSARSCASAAAKPASETPQAVTERAAVSAVQAWAAASQARFWTTTSDGTEERERSHRAALASAQQLLLDGHGCVTTLRCAGSAALLPTAESDIAPHETVVLPVTLMANLPGRYEETLRLGCAGISAAVMELPLSLEVRGKPVLLDPTTSGLTTTSDGHDVLVMPPTVACLGSSRRTLKMVNRVPRDVNVSVEMYVSGSTFAVTAVDDDVEASQVVLTLGPIPDTQVREDKARFGNATATPSTFFMAAMSTKEVHLEYVPALPMVQHLVDDLTGGTSTGKKDRTQTNASTITGSNEDDEDDEDDDRVKGAMSQEVDWEGSLVVQAELAQSAFNNAFLMDEFYEMNRDRFPSTRTLTMVHRKTGDSTGNDEEEREEVKAAGRKEKGKGAATLLPSTSRTSAMLRVVRPLITRPGTVVRNSKLVKPLQAETILVEHALHKGAGNSASRNRATTSSGKECPLGLGDGGGFCRGERDRWQPQGLPAEPKTTPYAIDVDPDSSDSGASSRSLDSNEDDGGDVSAAGTGSVYDNPVLQAAAESGALRPVQVLLAEDEERRLLQAYLAARYDALRLESHTYFSPIELLLRARCGVPLLAVQPSEKLVLFPEFLGSGRRDGAAGSPPQSAPPCRRTIRLTNHNSAALYFALRIGDGRTTAPLPFRILDVKLVPQLVDSTPLVEEDAESQLAHKAVEKLRWGDKAELLKAEKFMATQQAKVAAAQKEVSSAVFGTVRRRAHSRRQDSEAGDGTEEVTVYCLNGADSLDVTVAYEPIGGGGGSTVLRASHEAKPAVTATFAIEFYSSHGASTPLVGSGAAGVDTQRDSAGASRRVVASDLRPSIGQTVLLKVPLGTVDVSCTPSLLWFKPGQVIHDGRLQPSYQQRLRLFNRSKAPVHFAIVPRASARLGASPLPLDETAASEASSALVMNLSELSPRSRAAASPAMAASFKLREVMHMPETPCPGRDAAAARPGGQTGEGEVRHPFATVRGTSTASTRKSPADRCANAPAPEATRFSASQTMAATTTARDGGGEEEEVPAHFSIFPTQGLLPGATLGGEPGSVEVEVTFTEFSNVRYEDEFVVLADGVPTSAVFTLRGDSRETEL